jgi:hypothetical protein
MTVVLPNGYLTILQAADVLLPAIYGGISDRRVVSQLREQGEDVGDGQARGEAIAEIWKEVDAGALRAMAIGGRPRRIVRLDPSLTTSIPQLRSPRGRGFQWLRQSNPAYPQLASWYLGSLGRYRIPRNRASEARASTDASTSDRSKIGWPKEVAGPTKPDHPCPTRDQRFDCQGKMERHQGYEGVDQRGEPRWKLASRSEPRHRHKST